MADTRIGNKHGVAACNLPGSVGQIGAGNRSNLNGAAAHNQEFSDGDANLDSISNLKVALTIGGYSAADLNTMTYNDMVYAYRLSAAPLTIKQ